MAAVGDLVKKLLEWQNRLGKIDTEIKEKEATDVKPGQIGNARPLEVFYDGYVQSFLYEVVEGIQRELRPMDDIKPTSDETGREKLAVGDVCSGRLSSIYKEKTSAESSAMTPDDKLFQSLQTAQTTCAEVADSVLRNGSTRFDASKIRKCLEDVLAAAK